MRQPKYSVSIKITQEQFEKDFRARFERLGFVPSNLDSFKKCPFLSTSNFATVNGKPSYINYSTNPDGGLGVDSYSPDFYFALAAMSEGEKIYPGEYLIHTKISGLLFCKHALNKVSKCRLTDGSTRNLANSELNKADYSQIAAHFWRKEEKAKKKGLEAKITLSDLSSVSHNVDAFRLALLNLGFGDYKPIHSDSWEKSNELISRLEQKHFANSHKKKKYYPLTFDFSLETSGINQAIQSLENAIKSARLKPFPPTPIAEQLRSLSKPVDTMEFKPDSKNPGFAFTKQDNGSYFMGEKFKTALDKFMNERTDSLLDDSASFTFSPNGNIVGQVLTGPHAGKPVCFTGKRSTSGIIIETHVEWIEKRISVLGRVIRESIDKKLPIPDSYYDEHNKLVNEYHQIEKDERAAAREAVRNEGQKEI